MRKKSGATIVEQAIIAVPEFKNVISKLSRFLGFLDSLTFNGMVSCGITRRFPISLHRLFLRATNLRKPQARMHYTMCYVYFFTFQVALISSLFK